MIFISLIHGIGTIQHHIQPLRFVMRNYVSIVFSKFCHIPGSMRFQVCLIDHINAIFITQFIDQRSIRIMTGPNRIDVILFHDHKVFTKFCFRNISSGNGAEFMTVYTFEYNTFAIQGHNTVFHFKTTEPCFLRNHFLKVSCFIINFYGKIIKLRIFCAPENGILHRPGINFLSIQRFFLIDHFSSVFGQDHFGFAFAPGIGSDFQRSFCKIFCGNCSDLKIVYMHFRYCIKVYITINSRETEEVLIFTPAAGSPLEYLCCQFVFSLFYIFCQFKF